MTDLYNWKPNCSYMSKPHKIQMLQHTVKRLLKLSTGRIKILQIYFIFYLNRSVVQWNRLQNNRSENNWNKVLEGPVNDFLPAPPGAPDLCWSCGAGQALCSCLWSPVTPHKHPLSQANGKQMDASSGHFTRARCLDVWMFALVNYRFLFFFNFSQFWFKEWVKREMEDTKTLSRRSKRKREKEGERERERESGNGINFLWKRPLFPWAHANQ